MTPVLGAAVVALAGLFGGSLAAVSLLIRRAPMLNDSVVFRSHGAGAAYSWRCVRCDAVGVIDRDAVDSGGFDHSSVCPEP